jgi:hypothetical protein
MSLKTKTFVRIICVLAILSLFQRASSQVIAKNDTISCDGSSSLYAIPPGGVWSTTSGSTIVSPSSQSTSAHGLNPGVNVFTYTVPGQGRDTVIVTNSQVFANAGTDRTPSCLTTASLSGSAIPPSGTGTWALKYPAPNVILDNSNSNATNVSNLPFGNTFFIWTVEANGCSASDEVLI